MSAEAVREKLGPDVAAMMLTNPNTCGLFERDIVEIAAALHEAGAYLYCDGANFNAIAGKVAARRSRRRRHAYQPAQNLLHAAWRRRSRLGAGGVQPGAGAVRAAAADRAGEGRLQACRNPGAADGAAKPFGRLTAFHGQMGMFVRAMAYMLSHGADGLRQASEDAVLNANYVRVRLNDVLSQPFNGRPCMHEVLFDDSFLKGTVSPRSISPRRLSMKASIR